MASIFQTPDFETYMMDMTRPFEQLEPREREIEIVDQCLAHLVAEGILPHTEYDREKFLAHSEAVKEAFEIPWTAITPRMQRLLYAIAAILKPPVIVSDGAFCGFTFVCNAGAAVGPGACYQAQDVLGVEIVPEEAARAERNIRAIDPTGVARIVCADAVPFCANWQGEINLLYHDADGDEARGKGIYLDITKAAWEKLPEGAVILAHNSYNCAPMLGDYMAFVRDEANCRASVHVLFDGEGLEVSIK